MKIIDTRPPCGLLEEIETSEKPCDDARAEWCGITPPHSKDTSTAGQHTHNVFFQYLLTRFEPSHDGHIGSVRRRNSLPQLNRGAGTSGRTLTTVSVDGDELQVCIPGSAPGVRTKCHWGASCGMSQTPDSHHARPLPQSLLR